MKFEKSVALHAVKIVCSRCEQAVLIEIFFNHRNGFEKLTGINEVADGNERECLLLLMLQTQPYGFKWNETGLFSSDFEKLPLFVKNVLPKWSQKYFVECSEAIWQLGNGSQEVELILSEHAGHLVQVYAIDSHYLETEIEERFSKSKQPFYWSDRYGLIRLQKKTLAWVHQLNHWKKYLPNGQLPAYLMLSIFNPHPPSKEAQSWLQSLSKRQGAVESRLCGPFSERLLLRSYQKQGVYWLKHMLESHCHPLLADEMGLGKTRQLLTVLNEFMQEKQGPSLIVCPASVICSWQNEQEACFRHMPMAILTKDFCKNYKGDPMILLASYAQLRMQSAFLKKILFRCIILDEAQMIKNAKSKTAQICFRLKADYRIASTGTPLENQLQDLWSIFHFLMPGLLGTYKEFHAFIQMEDHRRRLKMQIAPFVLRRTREEVLHELPDKQETIVYCPMTQEQHVLYQSVLQTRSHVKNGQWIQLLTLILRLRQICCDPGLLPEKTNLPIQSSGKLVWLLEHLICLQSHAISKIIIFSQFKQLLKRLYPYILALYPKTYLLTGQTPVLQRRNMIKTFQLQTKAAFLISLKAGGTGITLNTADTIFILDPWWNPAVEQQAIARAHRLGQMQTLVVYRLLIERSIEATIQRMQKDRTQLFKELFESNDVAHSMDRWHQLFQLLSQKEET